MRILALIFALLGAAASGFVGLAGLEGLKKKESEFEAEKAKPGQTVVVDEAKLANLKRSVYALIAGIPLGVIGGVLALTRKGKVAALLLLIAYVLPVVILVKGVGVDFSEPLVKIILIAPLGFVLGALFAFFVKPRVPVPAI